MREPERLDPAYELEMARAELAEAERDFLRAVRYGVLHEGRDVRLTQRERRLMHEVARLDVKVMNLERMIDEGDRP